MTSRLGERKKKQKKQWLFWIGGILLVLLLAVFSYTAFVYNQVDETVEVMHEPLERDLEPAQKQLVEEIFESEQTLNILLLGVDEREADSGRSDTMILLSANPQTDEMLMLSIPRDTRTVIPGYGEDKINHAYAFGGTELAVQTVENLFDIPVHFYVKVNMEGFIQGIDAIDGVTVVNDFAFTQDGTTFPAGEIHLTGKEALNYTRMRKEDPQGDIGRNERQRQVIRAAMDKVADVSSFSRINEILTVLGENVRTNLTMEDMRAIFADYRQARKNIQTLELDGTGQMLADAWYYLVPEQEINRIQSVFQSHANES